MNNTDFHDVVRIVPYQEDWVDRFRAAKERIAALLLTVDIACDVRHVGGTSIPGMCSKPIVDVLVMVGDAELDRAANILAEHILCLGECGRPGRYFFSDGNTEHDAVYIHLTTAENQVARDQLAFKDMLMAHPALREEYAALKQRLAEKYPDSRAFYRMKKGVFIEAWLEEGYDVRRD